MIYIILKEEECEDSFYKRYENIIIVMENENIIMKDIFYENIKI